MARKVAHAIHDILEAIARVEEITRGKSLAEFEEDWRLQWLVQRAMKLSRKRAAQSRVSWRLKDPRLPWSRVRGIGNVLRHEYSGLSDRLIWNVVVDELPRLKAAMIAIAQGVKE